MMSNEFEEAFSEFLDRQAYDEAESALFDVVQAAFLAGWKAAGRPTPIPRRILQLLEREGEVSDRT